jgi:hypothetical protein
MYDLKAQKFYVRHREGYPETEVLDYSRRGFWLLGVEIAPYESTEDIQDLPDLSPMVGVAGYTEDVHWGLTKLNKPIPPSNDYPKELRDFLGRPLRRMKLGEVRSLVNSHFIKPVQQKLFHGMCWHNDELSRRLIATQDDDVDVWVSDLINFVSEYRAFILDGQVLDCRHYKGDWSKAPDKSVVEAGVRALKGNCPISYCLDWGITDDGRTVLVEFNDGYSFCNYGLSPVIVAHMLSARWYEMATTPDLSQNH